MTFERLPPHRIDALSDEELVEYLAAAHAAEHEEAEYDAMVRFAFGFEDQIRGWIRLHRVRKDDVDDLLIEVQMSMLKLGFDGKALPQLASFVKTITQRRVVDFWRSLPPKDKKGIKLGNEHEGEDNPGQVVEAPEKFAVVDYIDVVNRVLATRSELHGKVIRLYGPSEAGFLNLKAKEVEAEINADDSDHTVTAANVNQIWTRFRKDLKAELENG